jgi:hypothetical protein
MEVIDIINLFENHGIVGSLIIIFIFIITSLLKGKWFKKMLLRLSENFIEIFIRKKTKDINSDFIVRSITDSDITNHDIFNYIDFWTYSKIPTFEFSTGYRTVVFRKYLVIYLKSYKKNISKYVLSKDYQSMDQAQLSTSLLNLINNMVYDYERESDEVGIPKIVIEKMKIKNNDTIALTLDLIEGVCSSEFYSSDKNLLKVYSIMNILLSVLENAISNSENVCNSINGQLKGLKFTDGGKTFIEP